MNGSLRQRGSDAWQLRVYLGVDAETGRERWATTTVHGSRRCAQARLAEFSAEAGFARLRAGTVGDLLDRWLAAASPGWAASTVRETRSIVGCHLKPHLGHLSVAKLTTLDVDDFYGHLLRAGGRDGRPLAPGTVRRIHVVLHRALAQAVRWGWIWLNPASTASPPRVPPPEIRPPGPAQVRRLLALAAGREPALGVLLRLAASTGARRGQLAALRWECLDRRRATLRFTRALIDGPNGPVLQAAKTGRAYQVDLDRDTLAALATHRAAARQHARAAGAVLPETGFVFSDDPDGRRPWAPNRITRRFIVLRRIAQLPGCRLHDLRHFMATQMLDAGVPVVVVSRRLDHARVSTTYNVYTHAVPGRDRQAAETIASRLRRPAKRCTRGSR